MDKSEQKKYFWNNYLTLLSENGVKPALLTWYVRHCETFIRRNKETRLKQHTAESVSSYLNNLINSPAKEAWQKKQAIDALQYLFRCIRAPLHKEIDWDYWKLSCKDLRLIMIRTIERTIQSFIQIRTFPGDKMKLTRPLFPVKLTACVLLSGVKITASEQKNRIVTGYYGS